MALTGEAKKAYQRELMRKRRAEKAVSDLGLKEPKVQTDGLRTEMTTDVHPVYPDLKRYADREYNENGLVMKEQRCDLCNRTWGASIAIECPYCHGKIKKVVPT